MSTQSTTKTTQDVAHRLVELCRQGKVLEAQEELFADNVTSVSPDMKGGTETTVGKEANIEKGKQFAAMIEQLHSAHISGPVVAGKWASISWSMDVTMSGRGRSQMDEICVYKIEEGKIVSEQFFF